jgi:hypothetical protein
VKVHVAGDVRVRVEGGSEHQPDLVLHQHVGGAVAQACFRTGIGYQFKAKGGLVIMGRLFGIPHIEFNMIRALQRQEIYC